MQAGQQLSAAALTQNATMSLTTAAHQETGAKVRKRLTSSLNPTASIETVPAVCRTLIYQVLAFQ